ncbi:hypothetical protein [Burkholderia stabilis]|nr:hypothetical protein [Burkholderia stabilis]
MTDIYAWCRRSEWAHTYAPEITMRVESGENSRVSDHAQAALCDATTYVMSGRLNHGRDAKDVHEKGVTPLNCVTPPGQATDTAARRQAAISSCERDWARTRQASAFTM